MDKICLFDGLICRQRIDIWFAWLPQQVFLFFRSDRWAFCRRYLVGAFAHHRAIRLMPAGLIGSGEYGRPEWWSQWHYSQHSWKSARLVRQSLFCQHQQGIRQRIQHNVPSRLSCSWCQFADAYQTWTVWCLWWWGWTDDHWPLRWRQTSLIAVRRIWRPNWCRSKLTGHLSVAAYIHSR